MEVTLRLKYTHDGGKREKVALERDWTSPGKLQAPTLFYFIFFVVRREKADDSFPLIFPRDTLLHF